MDVPAETPESPPVAASPRRRKVIVASVAAVAAAGLVAVLVVAQASKASKAPAESERDVPHREGKTLVISQAYIKRNGIQTVPVQKLPLTPTIKVTGTATFDPAHVAAIGTRLRGFVRRTLKYEGDEVKEGDALAEIESAELGEAQATVAATRAQAEAAEINAKREKALLDKNLTTAREAEVADTTLSTNKAVLGAAEQRVRALGGGPQSPFGVYVLRAPISGSVVERHLSPGQSVDSNAVAYRVANLSHLWIELSVSEQVVGAVRRGDKVEVVSVSDTNRKIKGTVAHVGEVIDLTTRSADVRVAVENEGRALLPGQSVFATIDASGPRHEALLVPQSSVVYVDGKPTVFIAHAPTRIMPQVVKLGGQDQTHVEILEGVSENQHVVSEGVFYLKAELFR
jgi:cobalt-zinc-cadmium efflux system membrane fusion protein